MVSPLLGNHDGVSCDGCAQTAFYGNRYKCLRCADFDLCFSCYTTKHFGDNRPDEVPPHEESHPMQLILSALDFESVYEGDPNRRYDDRKIVSFVCPYCNLSGFTERQFGSHVTTVHSDPPGFSVICPLCIGIADMEHNSSKNTENLSHHWLEIHGNAMDVLRASEPLINATRPAQRRPMLARRTQRAIGGATRTTGVTGGAGRLLQEELGGDVAELIRNIRPDTAEELRRMTELLSAPTNSMIRNAHRIMTNAAGIERPPVVVESAMTVDHHVQQVIRPMTTIPIYPPTSDESGDETPQPAADSADESEDGNEIRGDDLERKPVVEDEDLKNDEFWQTLKTRIPAEDVELILETMKTTARVKEEKEEKLMPVWTARPSKPMANAAQITTTPDSEGEPGWLPLCFETTPLRSTGCGGYWSDKRFLRPRKMQREQSVTSSNAEIMEKAEVAMALCRASCAHQPEFNDLSKPDIALKEALKHLKLGEKPKEMMEYQPAEELVQMPERDPITTGEEEIEIPDFTARGYGQIVDGNVPLGVVPEADEAITNSEDEEVTNESSGEDEDEQEDEEDSQDSSIQGDVNIA